jgi:predicted transcriptional regulator
MLLDNTCQRGRTSNGMNIYRVYEELQGPFGEAGAKALASVLGNLLDELEERVTKKDLLEFQASVDANFARTDKALAELAEAQKRTEQRLDSLAGKVEELAEAQKRTEQRVEELAEAQKRTEQRLDSLAGKVEELAEAQKRTETRVGKLDGRTLELLFARRLPSYLGRFLRRAKVLQPADLLDRIDGRVTDDEADDFLLADLVASGKLASTGEETFLVCEISCTADAHDLERAARRTRTLEKAGLPARALVACEDIHPLDVAKANDLGVHLWVDGRLHHPAQDGA